MSSEFRVKYLLFNTLAQDSFMSVHLQVSNFVYVFNYVCVMITCILGYPFLVSKGLFVGVYVCVLILICDDRAVIDKWLVLDWDSHNGWRD